MMIFARLLLVFALFRTAFPCQQEIANLCKCQLVAKGGMVLDCSYNDFDVVLRVLKELNSPIDKLEMHGSNITVIRTEQLGSLLIKRLDLSGNGIVKIEEDAFLGQSDVLQTVLIANNSFDAIPPLTGLRQMTALDLSGNSISTIADNTFITSPKLRQLKMERNKICQLSPNALHEVSNQLELLDLSGNCLTTVPAQNLRGAQKLMFLDLSENHITDVPNLQFMNLPALKEVRLNDNRIRSMGPLAFMNVPNLQTLLLRNNTITQLEADRFQPFEKLELLDLSHNQIKKIPTSAFKEVKSLAQVILDNNAIESIETLAFSANPHLQVISLQNNQLRDLYRNAFDNLPQMIILLMNNNSLQMINRGIFSGMPNLQQLSLRRNRISEVESGGAFRNVPQLTTLDLGENNLETLPKDAFSGLSKLFWLDLCCNGLRSLPDRTFVEKVSNILLHDNILQCDDSLDWFTTYLVTHNVRTFLPEQKEVTCTGPPAFAGTSLKDLLIKKANATFFKTFNGLTPSGGEGSSPIPLGNLLPGLNKLPGLSNGIPGLTSPIPGLNALTNAVPGLNLIPGLNAVTNPMLSAGDGLVPAISQFSSPIQRIANGGKASAADVIELMGAVPGLVNELPAAPGVPKGLNVKNLPPELIAHVLNGGDVPGVPRATLDAMVKSMMQKMAEAAAVASRGQSTLADGTEVTTHLPELSTLPQSMTQKVLAGETLPYLTSDQTEAIKNYYITQATNPGGSTGVTSGGLSLESMSVSAADLLKYMPTNYDLTKLPPELLQEIANGKPLDLSKIPQDLIRQITLQHPNILQELAATKNDRPVGNEITADEILARLPELGDFKHSTVRPYDLNGIDRQNEIKDPHATDTSNDTFMYIGIGLAGVAVITVVTVTYLCYRRRSKSAGVCDRPPSDSFSGSLYQERNFADHFSEDFYNRGGPPGQRANYYGGQSTPQQHDFYSQQYSM